MRHANEQRPTRAAHKRLILALCLCLSSASCRAPHPASPPSPPAGATHKLTAEDRRRLVEEIWQTINDEYYDPAFNGVDWAAVRGRYLERTAAARDDFEFYGLCELMTAELRDSHTRYSPPQEVAPEGRPAGEAPREQPPGTAGFALGVVEGRMAVIEVDAGSAAGRAGVRPGMSLKLINGRAVAEIESQLRGLVAGASSERSFANLVATSIIYGRVWGEPRRLLLEDFGGGEFEYEVRREPREPGRVEARRLASGVAYIKFGQWVAPADRRFNEELEKMRDAPALVIDLRGNGGGQTDVLLNIAGNFFAEPTYYGGLRTRAGALDKYSTRKPARPYAGPVAILADERSASASETFSLFMQEVGRAAVVGRQTAGSTHNARVRQMRGGGTLTYSIRVYITPRGRDPEGVGVVPDEIIPLTLSDLRRGRDAVLEAAENRLRKR